MNNEYYISLTRGLQGYYVKVLATDKEVAREYASLYLTHIWCSVYDRKEIEELSKKYKTIVINEGDPLILGDSPKYE